MTAEHREVLLLREVEGLSYGELAQVLAIDEGTVKSRLARARAALVARYKRGQS
jgi:RNA polymerase sigma-70 factor (ECF subfamily)